MALATQVSRRAGARPVLLSSLSAACLRFLAEHPAASGMSVRAGLSMRHLSQASRLLARLERQGLVENQPGARQNHWRLSELGQQVMSEQDPIFGDRYQAAHRVPVKTNIR
jgi:DNA-binding MarR family transcriptional regulator